MNLVFEFGGNHEICQLVYESIYAQVDVFYPHIKKTLVERDRRPSPYPGGRDSLYNMVVYNADNRKCTILSFWERGLDTLLCGSYAPDHGYVWGDDLQYVHLIGGMGINKEMLAQSTVQKFTPFLYTLDLEKKYNQIQATKSPYVFDQKIKKAAFVGKLYPARMEIVKYLQGHPLIDIYDDTFGFFNEDYFRKMNEYAITLSLNGNAEICVRDLESMGLGIPIVRSELSSLLLHPIVPEVHYLRGSDPSCTAGMNYTYGTTKMIAEQLVDRIETALKEPEHLQYISQNGLQYYDNFVHHDKVVQEFFKVFNPEELS